MSERIEPGTLYIVSTPIGNLDDITLRAIKVLGAVDIVAAEDTRKTKILLDHLSLKKHLLSHYSFNESRRVPQLIELLRQGKAVAAVTDAGTPGISDPAYGLIKAAIQANIRIVPIPGATALVLAVVVSGLPTDRFTFEGFLPLKKGRRTKLEQLKAEPRTLVIYESPFRVVKTLEDILDVLGDRQVAVVRELTKKFEEVERGVVSTLLKSVRARVQRGEYVIVVAGTEYRDK